jgi:protein SCO1
MNKSVLTFLFLLLIASGTLAVWTAWKLATRQDSIADVGTRAEREAPPGSDQPILTEFTLTERSGKSFGTRDLEGQVWVASFFFSACPGSCRAQNLNVQALQNKYAPQGVKFVSITCDPRVDTPERLAEYATGFQARPDAWFFLTGDMPYIRRIGAEFFQVFVDERGHLDRFMAVDKWGNVRGYYDWNNPLKLVELGEELESLLEETEPPADVPPPAAATTPLFPGPDDEEEDFDDAEAVGDDADDEAAGEELENDALTEPSATDEEPTSTR